MTVTSAPTSSLQTVLYEPDAILPPDAVQEPAVATSGVSSPPAPIAELPKKKDSESLDRSVRLVEIIGTLAIVAFAFYMSAPLFSMSLLLGIGISQATENKKKEEDRVGVQFASFIETWLPFPISAPKAVLKGAAVIERLFIIGSLPLPGAIYSGFNAGFLIHRQLIPFLKMLPKG